MNDSENLKKLATLMDNYFKKEHVRLAEYLIEKKVPGYESLKKKKRVFRNIFLEVEVQLWLSFLPMPSNIQMIS